MVAQRNFIIIAVIVGLSLLAQADSKRGCSLFEYYDQHMDNCGPCREICDQMKAKRTEAQCMSQCSDYLVAVTCTYRQYYDVNVKACAPCSEICEHSDLRGTTQQCATQCQDYLKAQNCTDEEYFEEGDKECAACSELCSQRDEHGNTSQACFRKCLKYTEKYSSLIFSGDGDGPRHAQAKTGPGNNKRSLPFGSPGIMAASIIIGLIIIAATIGLVYRIKRRPNNAPVYAPVDAPANSIEVNVDDNDQTEDEARSTSIPMEVLASEPALEQAGQNEENPTAVAIQEQDPYASSCFCPTTPSSDTPSFDKETP